LSNYARDAYQMGGAVQHSASTLPASAFSNFPQNDTLEIHLATNFQNMMYDSALFPQKLKEEMYAWLHKNCAEEKKEGQTDDQFIYKTRKKALGPFKKQIMGMPDKVKEGIAQEIEANFDFLFKQLKAVDTKKHVEAFIKPVEVHLDFEKGGTAVLDGEGDD